MAGVYLSWPFCAQKCTYCNFASGVFPRELEVEYARQILREIGSHEWGWTPETIYLGGGTPSAMDSETLSAMLAALPGRPWSEATIEGAPGTLTRERVKAWREAGIKRVSLGVQSFVRAELARTGRKHDAAIVAQDVALLRENGIDNISVDLIAGLPGQTESSWRESIQRLIGLAVPHASIYMLEVDEDSRLGSEVLLNGARYGARDVPDEGAIAGFYEIAVEELRNSGLARYEISNFAKPGFESRHNLKYWRREPYIGFGADAHSFDGIRRWQNVESAQEYAQRSRLGQSLRAEETLACAEEEKFFVGLRLAAGVETDDADWLKYAGTFERLLAGGVMERDGRNLRLTARGIMVSNEIFQEFIAA
jgi:oxygen-independent coproporphyrinogen-3 oxidase